MGKVHGSLARAGKVKSQTPKVEKQEKSKVPKGRAKKRLQVSIPSLSPRRTQKTMAPDHLPVLLSVLNTLHSTEQPICAMILGTEQGLVQHSSWTRIWLRTHHNRNHFSVLDEDMADEEQYTRRFVNVTLTGGKRKMNPNPGT